VDLGGGYEAMRVGIKAQGREKARLDRNSRCDVDLPCRADFAGGWIYVTQ